MDDENETKSPLRNDDDTDDSIIGYWKWENSWTTQQIKMHVAAGSDLALHVVLAVIVNQIRYERNAIAMSVWSKAKNFFLQKVFTRTIRIQFERIEEEKRVDKRTKKCQCYFLR